MYLIFLLLQLHNITDMPERILRENIQLKCEKLSPFMSDADEGEVFRDGWILQESDPWSTSDPKLPIP